MQQLQVLQLPTWGEPRASKRAREPRQQGSVLGQDHGRSVPRATSLLRNADNVIAAGYIGLEIFQEKPLFVQVACVITLLLAVYLGWNSLLDGGHSSSKIMLVDLHCFKIPDYLKITRKQAVDIARKRGVLTAENVSLLSTTLEREGLGDATGMPPMFLKLADPARQIALKDSMQELEMVMYSTVDKLLTKTGIDVKDIGIVLTSCNYFAPTPSMAAMLTNHFKLRRDVLTYSLAGMGSSASTICVDMARHLLTALPNTVCLVFSHENVSKCMYEGNNSNMLLANALCRLGGAAVLLSNRPRDADLAKYDLKSTLRTHLGADDDANMCMGFGVDEGGRPGGYFRKTVAEVSLRAMGDNVRSLAPYVLPWPQLVKGMLARTYVPDFNKVFEHFLIHPEGGGILDSLATSLRLTKKNVQPAKATLERFGNLSSASTWYILAGIESSTGVRKGKKVWQLAFGSGAKVNSAVWCARRDILDAHECMA